MGNLWPHRSQNPEPSSCLAALAPGVCCRRRNIRTPDAWCRQKMSMAIAQAADKTRRVIDRWQFVCKKEPCFLWNMFGYPLFCLLPNILDAQTRRTNLMSPKTTGFHLEASENPAARETIPRSVEIHRGPRPSAKAQVCWRYGNVSRGASFVWLAYSVYIVLMNPGCYLLITQCISYSSNVCILYMSFPLWWLLCPGPMQECPEAGRVWHLAGEFDDQRNLVEHLRLLGHT